MKAIRAAIYNELAADTALYAELGATAIYYSVAPQGTARPYVIFFNSGGIELALLGLGEIGDFEYRLIAVGALRMGFAADVIAVGIVIIIDKLSELRVCGI